MISGAPVLSIEQVVINLRSIAELANLEVNAQSVEALIPQAERLLGVIQVEPDFVIPPVMPTASGKAGSAQSAALAQSWVRAVG
jgi:hypothetical protein